MNTLPLAELKQILSERQVMISFSGPFSHSVIEELGKAVRRYLEAEQVPKSALMDLFSVFIEQTQNVRNYTAPRTEGEDPRLLQSGIVVISRVNDHYAVSSGNLIRRTDAARLRGFIEQWHEMDAKGLRALYKERARAPLREGATEGAGLGLISMARVARRPLETTFEQVDDEYDFFSLLVEV